jgi:hypothetical protein
LQFEFSTYEFTPRMMFVPSMKMGPPESPKQPPPVCALPGFAAGMR